MLAARQLLLALPALALLAAPRAVRADDDDPPPPAPEPAPINAPGAVPLYPTPLTQRVQTTYVPQSVGLSGPYEITDIDPTRGVPSGYTSIQRPRTQLLRSGLGVLIASYGISALVAAIGQDSTHDGSNPVAPMWIPVAGPFLEMGQTSSATADVFLVGLGATQLAGAIMTYYGATTTQTVYVRNDLVGRLTVAPMVTHHASGLALSGSF